MRRYGSLININPSELFHFQRSSALAGMKI